MTETRQHPTLLSPGPARTVHAAQPHGDGADDAQPRGAGNVPSDLAVTYYAQRASAGLIVTEGTQVSPQGVGYHRHAGHPRRGAGRGVAPGDRRRPRARRADLRPALARGADLAPAASAGRSAAGGALRHRRRGADLHDGGAEAVRHPAGPGDRRDPRRRGAVRRRRPAGARAPASTASRSTAPTAIWSTSSCATARNRRTDAYGGPIENRARFLLRGDGGGRRGLGSGPGGRAPLAHRLVQHA